MTHIPHPPQIAAQETAIDTLARSLWAEAYGDPVRAKEAIAAVIINRVRIARYGFASDWMGNTVVEACLTGDLFSCWRGSSASRRSLMLIEAQDPVFLVCKRIAARAVRGALVDPTHGATHYHRFGEAPWWLNDRIPLAVIGKRKFYGLLPPILQGDGA